MTQKKLQKSQLPFFGVLSLTSSFNSNINLTNVSKTPKLNSVCLAFTESHPHNYSLKFLITVNFLKEQNVKMG